MKKWRRLASWVVFEHPRITLVEDDVALPDGSITRYLRFASRPGAGSVSILCRRGDGKILMQREYSYPPDQVLFQLPGGGIEPDEEPAMAANRELAEESGWIGRRLELLGTYYLDNRRSDVMMHVFLAEDLAPEARPADREEDIESFWFTEREIEAMIAAGQITNFSVLAAWSLYKCRALAST